MCILILLPEVVVCFRTESRWIPGSSIQHGGTPALCLFSIAPQPYFASTVGTPSPLQGNCRIPSQCLQPTGPGHVQMGQVFMLDDRNIGPWSDMGETGSRTRSASKARPWHSLKMCPNCPNRLKLVVSISPPFFWAFLTGTLSQAVNILTLQYCCFL